MIVHDGGIDRRLLAYARGVLEAVVRDRPPPAPPAGDGLDDPASVFITLRRGSALRGCVGDTGFTQPLYDVVRRMTEAAALNDPRFPPVRPGELAALSIEISRITPPRPAAIGEIVVGRHGIIVELADHRGLLLPQVAVEFACDAWAFVELGCRKAGLEPDAMRHPDLTVAIFEAEVLGE